MANELQITVTASLSKGEFDWKPQLGTTQIDVATVGRGGYVQEIGTSEETIGGLADVSTFGWALFKNLDSTNYVEIGPDSGGTGGSMVSMVKLLAGEFALLPLTPGITLKAQANTAAVKLDVNVLER